ncbi:MAG: hypothetical protein HYR85_02115 [Planctomycetes bacterium]|nr:hypothetical protein [Planctomycetota bacterium]MBI3847041.1 hypothetical protein [Planctomycetota bacterium]
MKHIGWFVVVALASCSKNETSNPTPLAESPGAATPSNAALPSDVKALEERGKNAADKTERLAVVNALEALKTEPGLAALGRLYTVWAADKTTVESRLRILEVFTDAAAKDSAGSERRILEAMLSEKGGTDSMQVVNKAGFDLATACWNRKADRVQAGRARFLASTNPQEQYALMIALVISRPEGLSADLATVYRAAKDPYLRANLILNGASLGDARTTFELAADAVDRPLNEENHIYFTCAVGALANLTTSDPSVRGDVVHTLVDLAKRKEMDAYVLHTIADNLARLDPQALNELNAPGTFENAELAKVVADAVERASANPPK